MEIFPSCMSRQSDLMSVVQFLMHFQRMAERLPTFGSSATTGMNHNDAKKQRMSSKPGVDAFVDLVKPAPTIVGTGLVALDVVFGIADTSRPTSKAAGGTCANVLTALSFLGWNAYPLARLGSDGASELVVQDLERWKVRERLPTTGALCGDTCGYSPHSSGSGR